MLAGNNLAQQMAARAVIMSMEEAAIQPLTDIYYAGVNDAESTAILSVIADIGGYEALNILRDIYRWEMKYPLLKRVAATGLLHNEDNLSEEEIDELRAFLSRSQ